jgi:Mn-dependent DtxR family transcriptional regulator
MVDVVWGVGTLAVKILKLLATYGPLDVSSMRRLLGVRRTSTVSAVVGRLVRRGLVEGFWLYKLTEKGRAALQYVDKCGDLKCLMRELE